MHNENLYGFVMVSNEEKKGGRELTGFSWEKIGREVEEKVRSMQC